MSKTDFVNARIPHPLRDRIDEVRPATTSRNQWVLDAIEMRLQDGPTPRAKPTARVVIDRPDTSHDSHAEMLAERQRRLEKERKR